MEQLQINHSDHKVQLSAIDCTVNKLHMNSNKIERTVQAIEKMAKSNTENIQMMNATVYNALEKALDAQKHN